MDTVLRRREGEEKQTGFSFRSLSEVRRDEKEREKEREKILQGNHYLWPR
jgi:hypothetical protein